MKKELIAICVTVIAGFLGWNAGKADRKEKLIYLVLAFLICVVNVYIQQMCF